MRRAGACGFHSRDVEFLPEIEERCGGHAVGQKFQSRDVDSLSDPEEEGRKACDCLRMSVFRDVNSLAQPRRRMKRGMRLIANFTLEM